MWRQDHQRRIDSQANNVSARFLRFSLSCTEEDRRRASRKRSLERKKGPTIPHRNGIPEKHRASLETSSGPGNKQLHNHLVGVLCDFGVLV